MSSTVGKQTPETVRGEFTVEFPHSLRAVVLELGGWQLIPLTGAEVILLDRNAMHDLLTPAKEEGTSEASAREWWIDHLDQSRFTINPILCALEGGSRQHPSPEEFWQELSGITQQLAERLSRARVVRHPEGSRDKLLFRSASLDRRIASEVEFLQAVAPVTAFRISRKRSLEVERLILDEARKRTLSVWSPVVLAALSCVYEPVDGSPPMTGRRVLHPKTTFTASDAYAVLSDIRALETLALMSGLDLGRVGLCTRDWGLASLWCGLGIANPRWDGTRFSCDLHPRPGLFPRLNEDGLAALLHRLHES